MPVPIITPVQRPSQGRKVLWGREDVQVGVPPTGGTGHPIFVEPVDNFDPSDQREMYEANELTGVMSDTIGSDELTHYVQSTMTSPYRAHGITAQGFMNLMGNQYYAPTGSGPYFHTVAPNPFGNRCNTLALWLQTTSDPTGAGTYVKQFLRGTVTSITVTFGAGQVLSTDMTIWHQWHTFSVPPCGFTATSYVGAGATTTNVPLQTGAAVNFQPGAAVINGANATVSSVSPTPSDALVLSGALPSAPPQGSQVIQSLGSAVWIGSDPQYTITRTEGYQGSFTIYGSTGTPYTPRIISGTLQIQRAVEAVFAADSQTIVDIALGPITVSGTMVFQFDGYAPGTVARDYSDYKPTGTYSQPNTIQWTDSDGNYIKFSSYPWKWNPFTLDYSGQYVKGNGTFNAKNDPNKVMQPLPILTNVLSMQQKNGIPTAMIGP